MSWKRLKKDPLGSPSGWCGFLDSSVRFEGTLEFPGTFRLEAQVKGTLISSQTLILGEQARVEGQIQCNHLIIFGRFDGAIFARGRVEIQAKGVVTGEIHTPALVIEPGGIFDGQCHMLAASDATRTITIPIRAAQQP